MVEPNDSELLARFRSGEEAALDRLFERYEGPVFRFLFGTQFSTAWLLMRHCDLDTIEPKTNKA